MNEWIKLQVDNLPKELTELYDFKSIKLGENEKIFYRKHKSESPKDTE